MAVEHIGLSVFAACVGGVIAYFSFTLMPGVWREGRDLSLLRSFVIIHSVLIAVVLLCFGRTEGRTAFAAELWRGLLLALLGGLGTLSISFLVSPYAATFFFITGRTFLNSTVAVLIYMTVSRYAGRKDVKRIIGGPGA